MPRQFLALDAGEKPRLELEWGGYMREFKIRLDGEPIGRIDGGMRELKEGREFTLPDGSTLAIRLEQKAMIDELQVLRDGNPLPGSAANPNQKLTGSIRATFLCGIIELIGGIALLATGSATLLGLGFHPLSLGVGLTLLVCAYFLSRWSLPAAYVAIGIFIGSLIYGGIGAFSAENSLGIISTLALLIRFLLIPSIAMGGIAVRQLHQPYQEQSATLE